MPGRWLFGRSIASRRCLASVGGSTGGATKAVLAGRSPGWGTVLPEMTSTPTSGQPYRTSRANSKPSREPGMSTCVRATSMSGRACSDVIGPEMQGDGC